MNVFFMIGVNVILPVFILVGAGVLLHRKFRFDMNTLSKLNTFLLMPTVSFVNIYQNHVGGKTLLHIVGFLILQGFCLMFISALISKTAKFDSSLASTFKNSIVLNNSGNFGLPVSQLVFQHSPLGASNQIIVMIFQNLLTYTYGLFKSVSVANSGFKAIKQFLKNPVIYAFLLGLLLHSFDVKIPNFLWTPIENVSDAFLAIALITLGAQSAYIKISRFSLPLILSLFGRLILSPCIALAIIFILKLEGTTAQALFIASSFPTSRNSALFALEYGNHPEYAAQAVLMSTIFSMVTVTTVIFLSSIIF
ncbi:AEC family transporter [Heyndrickxia camelliae]|uniref:Transporter n=1 Tax=Heyndrickxia camelliae TaxID=1707093 RepID=A0A2N3LIH0_9BACI|nr:AEC family transporter [Heyndrickxia camelliae]PKR84411.1 transporter [Heyndrickxia camelliae]